jgi:hypothetical protein
VGTPYEYLERVAAEVAPIVPDAASIVHVEANYDVQPFDVRFLVTPYDRKQLYDLSLRKPIAAPPEVALRAQQVLSDYFAVTQPLLDQDLVFLRISVLKDASFLMSQSCRLRTGATRPPSESR